jgi:coproporphyrinogen III oxidase-like Fe-S oxidoreductase
MFGLPGQNKQDMIDDIQMLRELCIDFPNLYCTMAYPGSHLYDEVLKNHPEWLPSNWAGYAQLSYETTPLPTEHLSAAEILKFRDDAFNMYFNNNKKYFDMIFKNFGQQAVDIINNILKYSIKRKILGE